MKNGPRARRGFNLVELLAVLLILGLAAALVIPRAMRAQTDSNFSLVRQYGSEISGYIMTWAQTQAQAQRTSTSFTIKDFLTEDVGPDAGAGLTSNKLIEKYTGNDDYNGVETLMPPDRMPVNPFNETSYFDRVNDDTQAPSTKPGLLYLASKPDPTQPNYLNFYLLVSAGGDEALWYGDADDRDPDKIRRGVFVARLYDDQESGAAEPEYRMRPE